MLKKLITLIIFFLLASSSNAENFFRKNYVYATPSCESPSGIRWWIDGPNNKLLFVNLNMSNSQIETFPVIKLTYNIPELPKGDFAFQYGPNSYEILTFYNDETMRIKTAVWNQAMSIQDYHISKSEVVGSWVSCANNYAANLISSKYAEYVKTTQAASSEKKENKSPSFTKSEIAQFKKDCANIVARHNAALDTCAPAANQDNCMKIKRQIIKNDFKINDYEQMAGVAVVCTELGFPLSLTEWIFN
jgi:hypothetical protein